MSVKRKSRWISDKERDELLTLSSKDCLKTSVFMDNFGEFNGKTKFHTYDVMKVPKGSYHNNKNEFVTTVGSWFFNKGCIDYPDLFKEIGYINEPITKKVYKKIQDKLSMAIMEDRVTTDQYKQWIMCCQKFMNYSIIICTTATEDYLLISKNMSKKKEELFKKYEKELANGDAFAMEKIEQELLKECSDMMEGDPAWDNVKSGSGADLGNNIKNQYICKGAQKDPDPTKGYNIIKSCYAEGVMPQDYSAVANSLAAGPYARAKKTSEWGPSPLSVFC